MMIFAIRIRTLSDDRRLKQLETHSRRKRTAAGV